MSDITLNFSDELPPPEPPSGQRTRHTDLLRAETIALYIGNIDEPFIAQIGHQATLGRYSMGNTQQPDIDLTAHGAYEKGVSRLHAGLRRVTGGLVVQDFGSSNGTWVNTTRLTPHTPLHLKSGDRLRLAHLDIEIYFSDDFAAFQSEEAEDDVFSLHRDPEPIALPIDMLLAPPDQQYASGASSNGGTRLLDDDLEQFAHYNATVTIDPRRIFSDVSAIMEQVVQQLTDLEGCEVKLILQIEAHSRNKFDPNVVSAIDDAGKQLNFSASDFS